MAFTILPTPQPPKIVGGNNLDIASRHKSICMKPGMYIMPFYAISVRYIINHPTSNTNIEASQTALFITHTY
jgi:hypothetical protein